MLQALKHISIGMTLDSLKEWLEEGMACHVHIHIEALTCGHPYLYI